jgi:hypothetical protein
MHIDGFWDKDSCYNETAVMKLRPCRKKVLAVNSKKESLWPDALILTAGILAGALLYFSDLGPGWAGIRAYAALAVFAVDLLILYLRSWKSGIYAGRFRGHFGD